MVAHIKKDEDARTIHTRLHQRRGTLSEGGYLRQLEGLPITVPLINLFGPISEKKTLAHSFIRSLIIVSPKSQPLRRSTRSVRVFSTASVHQRRRRATTSDFSSSIATRRRRPSASFADPRVSNFFFSLRDANDAPLVPVRPCRSRTHLHRCTNTTLSHTSSVARTTPSRAGKKFWLPILLQSRTLAENPQTHTSSGTLAWRLAKELPTWQKCIPRSWKQVGAQQQLQKPILCGNASMVGVLIASLKDFVTHGHISNAFKTFFQIQHHAVSSHLLLHPIASLLLACTNYKSLSQGKQLHAHTISLGLYQNPILVSRLIHLYTNVNLLADAQLVTETSNVFDPLHWNMLISTYVRNGFFVEALAVYKKMLSKQIQPDEYTYPSVLKACGESLDFDTAVEVHRSIQSSSMEWSLFVHNALVSMYGRFGKLDVARHLFDNMPRRDSVSWNTIISCYASRGMWKEAFQLFGSMQEEGVEMNVIIWNTIAGGCLHSGNFGRALKLISQMRTSIQLDTVAMTVGLNACSHIGAIKLGKEIHGHAVRTCFDVFENVKNALITMYSRCRDLGHAFMLFHRTEEKGLITWNAMLSGYAHMDRSEEVTFLFREMLEKGVEPNHVTIASVLPLCARIANLQHGKEFHCYIMKRNLFGDYLLLWNTLVDMYARSGRVLEARKVFDSLITRDEVTYTCMILGYGMKGEGESALKLFEEMCKLEIKPDNVTMVAVLTACSHSGLVAQGQWLFKRMINVYGIVPRLEHYSCMVDLFGRAGLLNKAKEFIIGMPYKPTSSMWATLIGACRIHGNTVMGEWAAGKLLEMKPDHSGYYVLIANMYAAAGCWSKLAEVRTYMRDLGVRKAPGCAWVDVGGEFSPFLVGDTSNPHASEIYPLMDGLNELMKDAGYVCSEEFEFVSTEEDFEEMNIVGNVY